LKTQDISIFFVQVKFNKVKIKKKIKKMIKIFEKWVLMFAGLAFFSTFLHAQQGVVSSGGDIIGSNGSISYSYGQIDYLSIESSFGKLSQGLQQPYEILSIDVKETENDINVLVFPNPSSHFININLAFDDIKNCSFLLYDIKGQLLESSDINQENHIIDMSQKISGTYIMKISKDLKIIKTFKIIKN
jgi:hypothetical protein